MIELKNVNKYFNKHKKNQIHVINDTSLTLESSGLVALLGQSGSGKTTLLNVIGGLDKVQKGKIYINGTKITRKTTGKIDKIRNLNIGYIFQDYKLLDDVTVFENVAIVLKMIGIRDKKEIKTRVDYVLNTLNIYRYRNKLAGNLSGGERQRVGIARAIVKDPNIIIADEPTGNLDSKNTLEIMNIIKSISKNRLVILVTHERNLADFYASRIIELKDGKIVNDYENVDAKDLDYRIDNNIYLKEFTHHKNINQEGVKIDLYSDDKENIKLNVIIRNGKIYLNSQTNTPLEVIDSDSGIKLINDHYKKLDKSIYQKYEFNFSEIINKNIKHKYTSIYNPFTLLKEGFQKVFDYSFVKKLLLLGFFASSMFITLSLSRMFTALDLKDESFIKYNKNYIQIKQEKVKVKSYLEYEQNENVKYMMPGDSSIGIQVLFNEYFQTEDLKGYINGSLSSLNLITKEDIIFGKMPEDDHELVIDKMALDEMFKRGDPIYIGLTKEDELIGKEVKIGNLPSFKIVGITDLKSPSIYASENEFINILTNVNEEDNMYGVWFEPEEEESSIKNVNLYKDEITLQRGKMPDNDYEVIVDYEQRYSMPLNKKIDMKVNGTKLTVVGYYKSKEISNLYLTSENTIKYELITKSSNITVYSENKEEAINSFRELSINVFDTYELSKKEYIDENKDSVNGTLIVASIAIAISLIEIFLMMRSSFLSRVKEVGTLRAIGVKKSDIYKKFASEAFTITLLACIPGVLIMSYSLKLLTEINFINKLITINLRIMLLSLLISVVFNLLVGLMPVFTTLRKTPAQILARHDLE